MLYASSLKGYIGVVVASCIVRVEAFGNWHYKFSEYRVFISFINFEKLNDVGRIPGKGAAVYPLTFPPPAVQACEATLH
jgi:hypothetical protein